jgi:hypothetical protein
VAVRAKSVQPDRATSASGHAGGVVDDEEEEEDDDDEEDEDGKNDENADEREKEKAEDDWEGVHSATCFVVFRCLFSFLIQ